jgi:hypothetical protein
MRIIGQFRDLDHPDRFVWLRGFADMEARTQALGAFTAARSGRRTGPPPMPPWWTTQTCSC